MGGREGGGRGDCEGFEGDDHLGPLGQGPVGSGGGEAKVWRVKMYENGDMI